MSRVVFVVAVLFCCIEHSAELRAEEFAWELSGVVRESEVDPFADTDRSAVLATYYFGAVEDGNGPYALATFFDPTTRVSAAVGREKQRSQPFSAAIGIPLTALTPPLELVTETDDYSLSGRYVTRGSRWYFGGRYAQERVEPPPASNVIDADSKGYGLLTGRYFGEATSLELEVDSSDSRGEESSIFCIVSIGCSVFGPVIVQTETDNVALGVMHARRFRALTYSLSGRISETSGRAEIHTPAITIPFPIRFPPPPFVIGVPPGINIPARDQEIVAPRSRVYSVGGELFPTQKVGVRVGYARFDGPAASEDGYDLAATWFVTRNVGVSFAFARQRPEDGSPQGDSDTMTVRAIGRF